MLLNKDILTRLMILPVQPTDISSELSLLCYSLVTLALKMRYGQNVTTHGTREKIPLIFRATIFSL